MEGPFIHVVGVLLLFAIIPCTTGENVESDQIYRPPFDPSMAGQPFHYSDQFLSSIDLPPQQFTELTGDFTDKFVIATGASADHFEESMDSVASVQKHFPKRKLLYFDLGLSQNQVNMLLSDGGNGAARRIICNVEYRTFNFSLYPEHVRDLHLYSWKFLIIKEVLQEFGAVFWIDSSVRFKSGNFMYELKLLLEKSRGLALFTNTGHSNFAVTDPGLYKYLPTYIEAQKKVEQWEGGNMLIYNTKEAYDNVLKWMYFCVLERTCILPTENVQRGCGFGKDRWNERARCHRHDQATVNLLLSNWHNFKTEMFTFSKRKINHVQRSPTKFFSLQLCEPLPSVNPSVKPDKGIRKVRFLPRNEL